MMHVSINAPLKALGHFMETCLQRNVHVHKEKYGVIPQLSRQMFAYLVNVILF